MNGGSGGGERHASAAAGPAGRRGGCGGRKGVNGVAGAVVPSAGADDDVAEAVLRAQTVLARPGLYLAAVILCTANLRACVNEQG